MKGKSHLVSKLKFILNYNKTNRAIFYMIGLVPELNRQKIGAALALFTYVMKQVHSLKYENVVFALMAEDNKSQTYVNDFNKEMDVEYTLYKYKPENL